MSDTVLSVTLLSAIGIAGYFFLRWKGVSVYSPGPGALFFMVVYFVTGILLTIVTGDKRWFWSYGRMTLWGGPILYVMIWLIRRFTVK